MPSARWKEIVESIQQEIVTGRRVPGERLPSEDEIASVWGVSRMTAHRAMHELQRMGLVIRRPRSGTIVAAKSARRTGSIALIIHNSHDRLEMEYMRGIQSAIGDENRLVVCSSEGSAEKEAHYLQRMSAETDGIILFPTCEPQNTPLLTRMAETGTHIVCIDRVPEGVPLDACVTDNYESTRKALGLLIAEGIYPMAHFTQGDLWTSAVRERYQAYLDVMRESGYPSPQKLCRHFPVMRTRYRFSLTQLARDALIAVKYEEPSLRGVFCLNDYHLIAVLEACHELGWRVPEDLEVLSYHDCVSLLPQTSRRIHRLVQQPFEIGRLAAQRLMQRLKGEALPFAITRLPAAFYHAHNTIEGGYKTNET